MTSQEPGWDLVEESHQSFVNYMRETRESDIRAALPVLVAFIAPPLRVVSFVSGIQTALTIISAFTEELCPTAVCMATDTYYQRLRAGDDPGSIESGELEIRFLDDDPSVVESIQVFTAKVGGEMVSDSMTYDTRTGQLFWLESHSYYGAHMGGFIADQLRMSLLQAGEPETPPDGVKWLAAASALEHAGHTTLATVHTNGDDDG